MRVVVIGAGAIGSVYGALLAEAGEEVTMVDVDPAVLAAVRRDGVSLEAPDAPGRRTDVKVSDVVPEMADAVLVLTKATATRAVAAALQGTSAIVVTLQNGLGNDAALAEVLGPERVVRGATTVGGQALAPGVVRVAGGTLTGASETTLERPLDERAAARVDELAAALGACGLPTRVVDDAGHVVWRKLALATAIGPLCAVLRLTVADVLASPAAMGVLERQFDEIVAVAAADGVELDRDELWAHALSTFRTIGPHPPSIAVDVAAGRPTEIEAQAGEVQRRGRAAGVPTPSLDIVTALVRAITSREQHV